ncbi:hypothetical protein J2X20_000852 [Pelomonas saccharophila]|uniref:SAF domain-containing protein n=1 Tax=Roseateles saccharophilus TaxID=304 RepID=A0ABU1YHC6_ROSSA|nr:flagella basal body P-ring formation protein FlgA [Roseateles saccharophilus]MDR7268223.1 hypothetical protein [Roseateles saccharophilus]
MNPSLVLALCGLTAVPFAQANPLCEAAQVGLERFARARGLTAEVRCRAAAQSVPGGVSMSAMELPRSPIVRSGPMTWPVRVQPGGGRTYVQQVPLTVAWTAPAWVSARDLRAGTELRSGDFELQLHRWPEGLVVQPADAQAQPFGRLRNALHTGDVLTSAALLPADALVRGDHVIALLVQGGVEIRLPARLLAPTSVGQLARVQASGRAAPLEGRLVDAQTLVVNE